MPTPRATRPPVSADAVDTALATVNGSRRGSTKMLVKKWSRSVTAPRAPMVTHGSTQLVNDGHRREPSAVYG